jgi:hypothetical protein
MPAGDEKDQIRERAYELWEREGRPHGRHLDHWVQAEREKAKAGAGPKDTLDEQQRQSRSGPEEGDRRSGNQPQRASQPGQGQVEKPVRSKRAADIDSASPPAGTSRRRKKDE